MSKVVPLPHQLQTEPRATHEGNVSPPNARERALSSSQDGRSPIRDRWPTDSLPTGENASAKKRLP